ncbi:hypothetical protein AQ490_05230 [Wenjunlia vitaminophila]|uniref:Uncharacterized protein n=2 Tax=Wenjunlia vitaminophila TaxID=76728 RepID=A0A0T6LPE2_WENVI|nr:hypothetical protein AQ490_05230 [Wenjunlia vitaminophila]
MATDAPDTIVPELVIEELDPWWGAPLRENDAQAFCYCFNAEGAGYCFSAEPAYCFSSPQPDEPHAGGHA